MSCGRTFSAATAAAALVRRERRTSNLVPMAQPPASAAAASSARRTSEAKNQGSTYDTYQGTKGNSTRDELPFRWGPVSRSQQLIQPSMRERTQAGYYDCEG